MHRNVEEMLSKRRKIFKLPKVMVLYPPDRQGEDKAVIPVGWGKNNTIRGQLHLESKQVKGLEDEGNVPRWYLADLVVDGQRPVVKKKVLANLLKEQLNQLGFERSPLRVLNQPTFQDQNLHIYPVVNGNEVVAHLYVKILVRRPQLPLVAEKLLPLPGKKLSGRIAADYKAKRPYTKRSARWPEASALSLEKLHAKIPGLEKTLELEKVPELRVPSLLTIAQSPKRPRLEAENGKVPGLENIPELEKIPVLESPKKQEAEEVAPELVVSN